MLDPKDALLGRTAVEMDLLGPEQLREALRERGDQPLGAILVGKKFLTGEQLLRVIEEIRRQTEGGAPSPAVPPGAFGSRYAVSGEIARGGMGIILDGQDLDIRRELAIKVLIEREASDPESKARFLEEAQIQGQLEHPNICPVHELGKDVQGRPYFTMKKVRGRSLFDLLESLRKGRDGAGYPLARLLGVFVKVCDAVAFAHSRGVLHRDLKPHNIMMGEFGEVLVMDWGLAKIVGRADAATPGRIVSDRADADLELSLQGSVLGTPAYMPPEQALGRLKDIDERSDVYSLGAILYEILTLHPPVEGKNAIDLITRAARGAIVPPSRRSPGRAVPADLEAASMKALATRREDRYASAPALRDDVTAFLEGRTLAAAEYTLLQIAAKWFRRNRIFALTASVAALVLLGASVAYVIGVSKARDAEAESARKAVHEANRAVASARVARLRLAESLVAQGDAYRVARRWSDAKRLYEDALGKFRKEGAPTLKADLALQEFYHESPSPLLVIRGNPGGGLHALAVSPDGRRLLSGSEGGTLRLLETSTGRELLRLEGGPRIWSVAFTPDGRRAVSAGDDGALKLWDLEAGKCAGAYLGHEGAVLAVAVSPDGLNVLSGGLDGTLRSWDLERGLRRWERRDRIGLRGLAVTPDGRRVLAGREDGKLVLMDLERVERIREFGTHAPRVGGVAISPDGLHALSAGDDGTLKLWDLEAGERAILRGHTGAVWHVAFSADGRLAASAGFDDTVRIWDLEKGEELRCLVGHGHDVYGVAFLPDGRRIVSASYDQSIRVWDRAPFGGSRVLAGHASHVLHVTLSKDGLLALSAGADGTMILWDVATGRPLRSVRAHRGSVTGVEFLPDGLKAVSCGADRTVALWDLASWRELRRFEGHEELPSQVAVSPEGRLAASASEDGVVRIWSLESARDPKMLKDGPCRFYSLAFSPDGRRLIAGGGDRRADGSYFLRQWEVESGSSPPPIPIGGVKGIHSLAFSPDGTRVLVATGQGVPDDPGGAPEPLALWNLATGRVDRSFKGHTAPVMGAAFVPGRNLIVSGGADKTLRVWNFEDGEEVRAFNTPDVVRSVAASPDGRWILAAAGNLIHRWELGPTEPAELVSRAATALDSLQVGKGDALGLVAIGEWHAFHGAWDWAAEVLGRAREQGAKVSPLLLGRCLWQAGDRAGARREFERALAEREAPEPYLRLCLGALGD